MIIPNSIPAWYYLISESKKYDLNININVDPFSGRQSGHMFFKDKGYPFRLEVFPKNMFLSFKEYSRELIEIWETIIENKARIIYETKNEFPYNIEWYYECKEEEIIKELDIVCSNPQISIIEKR